MMKPTTFSLSDTLSVAVGCETMINLLDKKDPNLYHESLMFYTKTLIDAINSIQEHSSPLDWTDEELNWIEDITNELNQGVNDEV